MDLLVHYNQLDSPTRVCHRWRRSDNLIDVPCRPALKISSAIPYLRDSHPKISSLLNLFHLLHQNVVCWHHLDHPPTGKGQARTSDLCEWNPIAHRFCLVCRLELLLPSPGSTLSSQPRTPTSRPTSSPSSSPSSPTGKSRPGRAPMASISSRELLLHDIVSPDLCSQVITCLGKGGLEDESSDLSVIPVLIAYVETCNET